MAFVDIRTVVGRRAVCFKHFQWLKDAPPSEETGQGKQELAGRLLKLSAVGQSLPIRA
jgi:hypothetical protein